jgi:hypothetical protein
MTLYRIAEKSFILAGADWTAGETLRLLEPLGGDACLVVARDGTPDDYFLFTRHEAVKVLSSAPHKRALAKAFKLDGRQPTPALSAYQSERDAPRPAIVVDPMDRDRVIGVLPPLDRLKGPEPAPAALAAGPTTGAPDAVARGAEGAGVQTTRAVKTSFADTVTLNEVAVLKLWLSQKISRRDRTIRVVKGSEVIATVKPRLGFEIVGSDRGALTVTDASKTEALEFKLKAVEAGAGVIRVYLSSGGLSLGYFDLESEVVEGATLPGVVETDAPMPAIPVVKSPDLTLEITEKTIEGEHYYSFLLRDGEIEREFGTLRLRLDPEAYFHEFFGAAENLDPATAREDLKIAGLGLFADLFPEDLQKELWDRRSHEGLTVQIVSDDSWVPWELCCLQGFAADSIEEGPFLCEAFAITRWLRDATAKPVLHIGDIALVVPEGSGLPSAVAERDYLLSLGATPARRVTPIVKATRGNVWKAMAAGTYGAWHFTCHGFINTADPDKSALELDEASQLLPKYVVGQYANMGKAQPLVFLNACQTGAGGHKLTGAGGWAETFLKAAADKQHPDNGAAAFIGTYWSVDDGAALTFAKAFYGALLNGGATVGEAARVARRKAKDDHPDDVSYLAYTVYAHPLARVA